LLCSDILLIDLLLEISDSLLMLLGEVLFIRSVARISWLAEQL